MLRTGAILVGVVVLLSSCNLQRRDPNRTTAPAPTDVAVGQDLASFQPQTPAPPDGDAAFVLTLTDQNDLHPSGIPVQITGPEDSLVLSDGNGQVHFAGPDGFYRFQVLEGCHDAVEVLGGGYAEVGITRGQSKPGVIPVRWQHRFAPAPPIAMSSSAWNVGEPVVVRFLVIDRCADAAAPDAPYPSYRFQTSANLVVVGEPELVSDGEGHGRVTVRCESEGATQLVVTDERNPTDSLDLLREAVTFGPPPSCG